MCEHDENLLLVESQLVGSANGEMSTVTHPKNMAEKKQKIIFKVNGMKVKSLIWSYTFFGKLEESLFRQRSFKRSYDDSC